MGSPRLDIDPLSDPVRGFLRTLVRGVRDGQFSPDDEVSCQAVMRMGPIISIPIKLGHR